MSKPIELKITQCQCGDPICSTFQIQQLGTFYQGCGFDLATAVQICCSLSAQLPDEYSYVAEAVASTKEPEPTVPHHYLASLYGGSGGIYVSLDETAAYREAELDAGRGNLMSLRPATEDEVAWHKSMGGRIQMVNPVPTAPANEAQSEVDHQVDFQYHRLGRD